MISNQYWELDRPLVNAKLLEEAIEDRRRGCRVKVNVQGGVDVQVQVNDNVR